MRKMYATSAFGLINNNIPFSEKNGKKCISVLLFVNFAFAFIFPSYFLCTSIKQRGKTTTMWKSKNFSVTQILREITLRDDVKKNQKLQYIGVIVTMNHDD